MRSAASYLILGLVLAVPRVAGAQVEQTSWRPFIGVAAGLSAVPRPFMPTCAGWSGHAAASVLEARLGVAHGRFGVELRTSQQAELAFLYSVDCLHIPPVPRDGEYTIRTSAVERDPIGMSDIRLRFALASESVKWLLAIGPGFVWSGGGPTISIASGIRFGRRVQGLLDVDLTSYRVKWDNVTGEWSEGDFVRVVDQYYSHSWRSGLSLRAGLEIPVGG